MSQNEPRVQLVKTCTTCFHAKIRCDKTQDSGLCDRCLRLNKPCVFAPSKRRTAATRQPRGNSREPQRSVVDVDFSTLGTSSRSSNTPPVASESSGKTAEASFDPFKHGLVSFDKGQELLEIFRARMTPHFPFVIILDTTTIHNLLHDKPALCLAIVSAASFRDMKVQRALGRLFNDLVAFRMIKGPFATLDLLQGLLVHLAWAHYQPRPRRHSQHLHLAISIIADLRMDRPKNGMFWTIDEEDSPESRWGMDEMRALAGVYYLSSSTSVLLQKPRSFYFTPYIHQCCHYLASHSDQPTDQYLPFIVQIQKLIDNIDELSALNSPSQPQGYSAFNVQSIEEEFALVKSTLGFVLSESPTLALQIHMLDLLLNQSSSNSTFGLDKISEVPDLEAGKEKLVSWLSESMFVVKSITNVLLLLPPGEELGMTNPEWIMLYCGLALAMRLDLLASHPQLSAATQQVRRFLDVPHTFRQTLLRLESGATEDLDSHGDRDTFFHLCRRARRLQDWYQQRSGSATTGVEPSTETATPYDGSMSIANSIATGLGNQIFAVPMAYSDEDGQSGMHVSALIAEYGSQLGVDNFSFTEPFEYFDQ